MDCLGYNEEVSSGIRDLDHPKIDKLLARILDVDILGITTVENHDV
jgi:hypothetical protein